MARTLSARPGDGVGEAKMLQLSDRRFRNQTAARTNVAVPFLGLLILAVTFSPDRAAADLISPSFSGPTLDPGLTEVGSAGTSYTVGNGTLTLQIPSGLRSGDVLAGVATTAPISGDFVVSVDASGPALGRADLGILIGNVDFSDRWRMYS